MKQKQTAKEPKENAVKKTLNYDEKKRLQFFFNKLKKKGADVNYYKNVVELVVFFEKKIEEYKFLDSTGENVINKIVIVGSNYISALQKLDKIIEQDKKTTKKDEEVDCGKLLNNY